MNSTVDVLQVQCGTTNDPRKVDQRTQKHDLNENLIFQLNLNCKTPTVINCIYQCSKDVNTN